MTYRNHTYVTWTVTAVKKNHITGHKVRIFEAECDVKVAYNGFDDWEPVAFRFADGLTTGGKHNEYTVDGDDAFLFAILLQAFKPDMQNAKFLKFLEEAILEGAA
jgi:hypothetical protein